MMTRWLVNIFTTPLFYLGGESISLLWILKILGLLILRIKKGDKDENTKGRRKFLNLKFLLREKTRL